jgi:prepilin-type N-terminal cleavage/methylation domain-containing protein/prepilin-type processing-associated H-X9-DG protein
MKQAANRVHAFTLIEILVVIGIIAILIAILLPAAEHVRHQAYIDKCASNVRQIGLGLSMYANENHGQFPRTLYVAGSPLAEGTGINSPDPFTAPPVGPQANDITANVYLLMRAEKLPSELFICPYNDETSFVADKNDPIQHANFADQAHNLGYSFVNPYPDAPVVAGGYQLSSKLPSDFAIASDRNPGVKPPRTDVLSAAPNSPWAILKKANSENHEEDGQNVLYGDGHVAWQTTPFCGVGGDNIFTSKGTNTPLDQAKPTDKTDSVLLPVDE